MAGEKFIQHDDANPGTFKNVEAVQTGGTGSENKIVSLKGDGTLDRTMMPPGIGADTVGIVASEDLSAGDFVNIFEDSSVVKCRKADASNAKHAHGFVETAVTSGANATIFFDGNNAQVTGATPGQPVFLSATNPGGFTHTAPTADGHYVQGLGIATSATNINFNRHTPMKNGA